MMKKFCRLLAVLFIMMVTVLSVSCPATPPGITDSGLAPYQKPLPPSNVKVVSGMQDKIDISWDAVEDADLYIVYMADATNPSELHRLASTNANMVSVNKTDGAKLHTDSTYVFTVISRQYFGSDDYLDSDYSSFVEGAIAPTSNDMQFHIYIVGNNMNLYWNCRNLFRQFEAIENDSTLYNATFTLFQSTDNWQTETEIKDTETHTYEDPWLDCVLNVNNFVQGQSVSFRVVMTINYENGSAPITIEGPSLSIQIISDMNTSPISSEDITVTEGDRTDGIEVSWIVPSWTGELTEKNSYFKLERMTVGVEKWDVLVNELDGEQNRDLIKSAGTADDGRYVYKYFDQNVKAGERYVYRITNAVSNATGVMYSHSEEELENSPEAYLYEVSAKDLSGTFTPSESNIKADVVLNWNFDKAVPDNLEWRIVRVVKHPDSSVKDDESFIDTEITVEENTASTSFTETVECQKCAERTHMLSYILVVTYKDSDEYYGEAGKFNVSGNLDYRGLVASSDKVNSIEISWAEVADGDTYQYQLNGGQVLDLTNITRDGSGICTAIIPATDPSVDSVTLKSKSSSGEPYDDLTAAASIDNFDELSPIATTSYAKKIVLSWNTAELNEEAAYFYQWKTSEGNWSEKISVNDFASGSEIFVPDESIVKSGSKVDFRIVIENKEHPEYGMLLKDTFTGNLLAVPTNVTAEKGQSTESISIEWDEVADAVEYVLYRYEEGQNSSNAIEIGRVETASFDDTDVASGISYIYLVSSVDKDGEVTAMSSDSGTIKNLLGKDEPINMGYLYNSAALSGVTVTESVAAGNVINDYFVVSFYADKTNEEYVISTTSDPSFTFSLSDIVSKGNNGISSDKSGYVGIDDSGKITANVQIGVVDYTTLKINSVSVKGETSGVGETETTTLKDGWYRGLTEYEYLNLFNPLFSALITDINGQFGGDWWRGDRAWDGVKDASGEIFEAYNCDGTTGITDDGAYHPEVPGKITITSYKNNIISFNSGASGISVWAKDGDSAGSWTNSGYRSTDPLDRIGYSADSRTVYANVILDAKVNGQSVVYPSATITINNISLNSSSSSESCYVAIDGKDYGTEGHMEIFMNDPLLTEKIKLN